MFSVIFVCLFFLGCKSSKKVLKDIVLFLHKVFLFVQNLLTEGHFEKKW